MNSCHHYMYQWLLAVFVCLAGNTCYPIDTQSEASFWNRLRTSGQIDEAIELMLLSDPSEDGSRSLPPFSVLPDTQPRSVLDTAPSAADFATSLDLATGSDDISRDLLSRDYDFRINKRPVETRCPPVCITSGMTGRQRRVCCNRAEIERNRTGRSNNNMG